MWAGKGGLWLEHPLTIKRYADGVKKQEAKPEPKKPVGWWA